MVLHLAGHEWHGGCFLKFAKYHIPEPSTMSSLPQTTATTDELPKDVADLAAAIAALPAEHRSRLEPMMFRVVESTRRRRRILNLVQEALSQLRLDMKYLVFDLEATRRERDALQHDREGDSEL